MTFETDRLFLRPWQSADVDFVFDLYSRWEVQQFIGLVPRVVSDRAEAQERLDRMMALDDPVLGWWAIGRRDTGALVGALPLKPIPASGSTQPLKPSGDIEIGWHLHPDAWGKGFATEAATVMLAHAFDSGLQKVVAVTNPLNLASQAVCGRIGMAHLGLSDRYYNATCELFEATPADR